MACARPTSCARNAEEIVEFATGRGRQRVRMDNYQSCCYVGTQTIYPDLQRICEFGGQMPLQMAHPILNIHMTGGTHPQTKAIPLYTYASIFLKLNLKLQILRRDIRTMCGKDIAILRPRPEPGTTTERSSKRLLEKKCGRNLKHISTERR